MSDYKLLPTSADSLPAKISPEGAEVASIYLGTGCSLSQTARELGMPAHEVSEILEQKIVKTYILNIMQESTLRRMEGISEKMENLIDKKLIELEEAEIGSNKDIADLLQIHHKMQKDALDHLERRSKNTTTINQKNTQVNVYDGNYGALMAKLMEE